MQILARGLAALFLGVALFLGLAGGALPAWAAQDGQVFNDWTVRCEQQADGAFAGGCYIFQSVINKETQKPVMQIAIGLLAEDRSPAAIVSMPLGVLLPPGVAMQIDEQQPVRLPFHFCMPDGCQVRFRLTPEQIAIFKGGITGKMTIQDPSGRANAIPFSLKGFTAALGSLG